MSLHRVDPRFVLPHAVRTAVVLGGLDEWSRGLAAAGVETARGDTVPDLAVAPIALRREAAATGARSLLLEGAGPGSRLLLRPTRTRPTLALPLDQRVPAAYALERWSVVDRQWKSARMHVARGLVRRGQFPGWAAPTVTVRSQVAGPPDLVVAAAEVGVPTAPGWFLTFGQGDSLSRNAFQLFPPGEPRPEWILKFARVSGYTERFDNDERGLGLALAAGGAVAAHAPRLVGRFRLRGLEASVETAAHGRRLRDVLSGHGARAAKLELVASVAAWTIELGRLTRDAADTSDGERARLAAEVVPSWRHLGAQPELVAAVPPVETVLQHNDLGSWNVVADGPRFTVVDWENVRERAFPLWDLLYFLADALVLVDGPAAPEELPARVAALFAGEAPSSATLFAWTRRGAAAAGVPDEAIPPLAALCWLSHSHSFRRHNADLATFTPGDPPRTHGLEGIAAAWMAHPALGDHWSAWRA